MKNSSYSSLGRYFVLNQWGMNCTQQQSPINNGLWGLRNVTKIYSRVNGKLYFLDGSNRCRFLLWSRYISYFSVPLQLIVREWLKFINCISHSKRWKNLLIKNLKSYDVGIKVYPAIIYPLWNAILPYWTTFQFHISYWIRFIFCIL